MVAVPKPRNAGTDIADSRIRLQENVLIHTEKKYAWRVQARTTSGFGDGTSFENNGYSEIYDFTFKGDCDKPQFVIAEPKTNTQVKVSWQQNPNHTHYMMQTRKKGTTEWFDGEGDQPMANINDLEAGQSYEFRVGAYCVDNVLSFSPIIDFTMPEKKSKDFQCGLEPTLNLSNQTPYTGTLKKGDEFIAGDFPVRVLEASGNGAFSGKGWIKVPFLGPMRIAVEFKDIQLNTDLQLMAGEVKTTYDPEWKNVLDVNEAIGDVKETVDAIGDLVAGISELFKKWDDLEEQKKQNKISETDYNKQWKEVYNEITNINDKYIDRTSYDDFPKEIKENISSLDKTIKELENTNFNTPSTEVAKNAETLKNTYEKVEDYAKSVTLLDVEDLKENPNQKLTMSDYGRVYNSSGELQETKSGDYVAILMNKKPYKLSQLDYTKQGTLKAVAKIIKTEAEFLGFSGLFGVRTMKDADIGAYTSPIKDSVMVNIKSIKLQNLDNVYNLRNLLEHEADSKFGHISEKIDANKYTFLDHAKVYFEQSKTESFKKSNIQNKHSVAYGYAVRVYNASLNGTQNEGKYIVDFNTYHKNKIIIKYERMRGAPFISIEIDGDKREGKYAEKLEKPQD